VEKTNKSQAKPMTLWCLLVFSLVAIFVAMGIALFFRAASGDEGEP
jgi:hypothetical protein